MFALLRERCGPISECVSIITSMADEFEEGPEDLEVPPAFFPYEKDELPGEPIELGEPVEVQIEGVFAAEQNGNVQRIVLLSDGERKLPIIIGPFEAQAIIMSMEGATPDRPMTHDLLKTVIERLHGTVERIVIDDIWSTTYYAKVFLRKGDEEFEIDSRPSDAIALAVRFECPILVAEGMLAPMDD